jgi:hypothetical protein
MAVYLQGHKLTNAIEKFKEFPKDLQGNPKRNSMKKGSYQKGFKG